MFNKIVKNEMNKVLLDASDIARDKTVTKLLKELQFLHNIAGPAISSSLQEQIANFRAEADSEERSFKLFFSKKRDKPYKKFLEKKKEIEKIRAEIAVIEKELHELVNEEKTRVFESNVRYLKNEVKIIRESLDKNKIQVVPA